MNWDRLATILGAIGAGIQVWVTDIGKAAGGDPVELGKLGAAAVLAALGYVTNKK